jgi:hypothetical protein
MFSVVQAFSKWKFINNKYIGIYLLFFTLIVQYLLHLPLSYLSKQWFWQKTSAVKNIDTLIKNYLPLNASVVSQNNITPHISQRDKIYTLYPEKKIFQKNSPCGKNECNWFNWFDNPEFLIVDSSSDWDARHLLIDRPLFIDGLKNIEKAGIVTKFKQVGSSILYKVNKNPSE